jgi:hypothetical protein
VALVVIAEKNLPIETFAEPPRIFVSGGAGDFGQFRANHVGEPELFLQPERHCTNERGKSLRRVIDVRLEQAFELQQRLVIEADIVDVANRETRLAQAIRRGLRGETMVVLHAGKPFLLRGRDDVTVDDQARGRVVVER